MIWLNDPDGLSPKVLECRQRPLVLLVGFISACLQYWNDPKTAMCRHGVDQSAGWRVTRLREVPNLFFTLKAT